MEEKVDSNNLTYIKVTPLAAESFGVRSMCTLVETSEVSILLDAGISLAAYRFSLPPHPEEFRIISNLRQMIAEAANKVSVTTISHYHFDHHTPSFEDWVVNWTEQNENARQIYQNKTVLAKNSKENINTSQRQRALSFEKNGGKHAIKIESADGKTFTFGKTKLSFSQAVFHGSEDSMQGWTIMTNVEHNGERFMFAPDVQGPISKLTTELILSQKPHVLMLGGPPLYLEGYRMDAEQIEQGLDNLNRIVKTIPVVILDHHALRDENWRLRIERSYQKSIQTGHMIVTAAEYAGKENNFLESKRKQLYQENPPSEEFRQWMKTLNDKKIARPPI